MDRPITFRTRRGARVFRQAYRHKRVVRYAENYSVKIKRDQRQYYFNLGPDKKAATKTADEITTFLAVKSHTIEEALALFVPGKTDNRKVGERHVPTVQEFCARYREAAVHLSETTIQNNICAIRRIVAHILGYDAHGKSMPRATLTKWRARIADTLLSRITPEQLINFRSSLLRKAGTDQTIRARATTTTNSYLRCAGSMFSRKWRLSYQDFILPDPNPFNEVERLREPSHRYHSRVNISELAAAAKRELAESEPSAYLVFVLGLYCGMRRKEMDRLRWDQIDFERRHIWIVTTAESKPKSTNSESRIDAIPQVFETLTAFRAHSINPPYVLPGSIKPNVRYRCKKTYDMLIPWLRAHGMPELRTLHSLRKEAGSVIFEQHGSIDLAADFLRNDPRVAREHYIGRRGRLELVLPKMDRAA